MKEGANMENNHLTISVDIRNFYNNGMTRWEEYRKKGKKADWKPADVESYLKNGRDLYEKLYSFKYGGSIRALLDDKSSIHEAVQHKEALIFIFYHDLITRLNLRFNAAIDQIERAWDPHYSPHYVKLRDVPHSDESAAQIIELYQVLHRITEIGPRDLARQLVGDAAELYERLHGYCHDKFSCEKVAFVMTVLHWRKMHLDACGTGKKKIITPIIKADKLPLHHEKAVMLPITLIKPETSWKNANVKFKLLTKGANDIKMMPTPGRTSHCDGDLDLQTIPNWDSGERNLAIKVQKTGPNSTVPNPLKFSITVLDNDSNAEQPLEKDKIEITPDTAEPPRSNKFIDAEDPLFQWHESCLLDIEKALIEAPDKAVYVIYVTSDPGIGDLANPPNAKLAELEKKYANSFLKVEPVASIIQGNALQQLYSEMPNTKTYLFCLDSFLSYLFPNLFKNEEANKKLRDYLLPYQQRNLPNQIIKRLADIMRANEFCYFDSDDVQEVWDNATVARTKASDDLEKSLKEKHGDLNDDHKMALKALADNLSLEQVNSGYSVPSGKLLSKYNEYNGKEPPGEVLEQLCKAEWCIQDAAGYLYKFPGLKYWEVAKNWKKKDDTPKE